MIIRERNIVICIVLTFVTCGIYGIYWMYRMIEETDYITGNPDPKDPGLVIVLGLVTCGIYLLMWLYNTGKRFDEMSFREGRGETNYGVIFLLLGAFGCSIVDYALIQDQLNKHANA